MPTTTTLSNYKKPPLRRDDSGELDVFEAARYFSNYNDKNTTFGGEARQGYLRHGRSSLDNQIYNNYYKQKHQNYTNTQPQQEKQNQINPKNKQIIEIKTYNNKQQPSFPSSKLANFLSSIFNQTIITSKKKKQPKSTLSMIDEDEMLNDSRRRRRSSSLSHFRPSKNSVVDDSKSLHNASISGFDTKSLYNTNTCQNVRSFLDYKQVLASLSKYKIQEKEQKSYNNGNYYQEKKIEIKKFSEEIDDDDDGLESDSSSDLFELHIGNESKFSSSELPVYKTTHLYNNNYVQRSADCR